MALSSTSGRVPQGEVVMEFADGGSYIKHKLENAAVELERRRLKREEVAKATRALEAMEVKAPEAVNAADVEVIVKELGVDKATAEKALRAEKGDLVKTLVELTAPSS